MKLLCPECLSDNLIKVGRVWSGHQLKQEYRCKNCGRLTIKPINPDTLADKALNLNPA